MVLPESRVSIQPTGLFTNCQADPVLVPLTKPSEIQSALSLPTQLMSADNRYSRPETGVNGRKALMVELGTFARVPSVVQPLAAIQVRLAIVAVSGVRPFNAPEAPKK